MSIMASVSVPAFRPIAPAVFRRSGHAYPPPPPRRKREVEVESDHSVSSDDEDETFEHPSTPVSASSLMYYAAIVEQMRAALPVLAEEPPCAAPKPTAQDVDRVGELLVFINILVALCPSLIEISEMLQPIDRDSKSYPDVSKESNRRFIPVANQFREIGSLPLGVFIRQQVRAVRCAREMTPAEQHSVQSNLFTFLTHRTYVNMSHHSDTFDSLVVVVMKFVGLLSHIAVDDKVYDLFDIDENMPASIMSRIISESLKQVNEEVIKTMFARIQLTEPQDSFVARICYEMFL